MFFILKSKKKVWQYILILVKYSKNGVIDDNMCAFMKSLKELRFVTRNEDTKSFMKKNIVFF